MRIPSIVLSALTATAAASLPAQTATDVGLRIHGATQNVSYGQQCGPFSCTPVQASPTLAGQPYTVSVFGALQQPFALAIDIDQGQPCFPVAGIANSVLVYAIPVTLAFGSTSGPTTSASCIVGRGGYTLQFPNGTPPGVAFLLQAVAMSGAQGTPAFTIAIRSVTG